MFKKMQQFFYRKWYVYREKENENAYNVTYVQ